MLPYVVRWTRKMFDQPNTHTRLSLSLVRRERNRMHAKMTRDRKKCYIATIQKTIDELESDIRRLQDILTKVQESQAAAESPSIRPAQPVAVPDSLSPIQHLAVPDSDSPIQAADVLAVPASETHDPERQTDKSHAV